VIGLDCFSGSAEARQAPADPQRPACEAAIAYINLGDVHFTVAISVDDDSAVEIVIPERIRTEPYPRNPISALRVEFGQGRT
jgi:hypothetical protein